MSLTYKDKECVRTFWQKVYPKTDELGAQALARMLISFPETKGYFPLWTDYTIDSPSVKRHGAFMMGAFGDAVTKIDDLMTGLSTLGDLHAVKLQLDPASHKLLFYCTIVVFGMYFPKEFTPEVQLSVDKFLNNIGLALGEKYR